MKLMTQQRANIKAHISSIFTRKMNINGFGFIKMNAYSMVIQINEPIVSQYSQLMQVKNNLSYQLPFSLYKVS